MLEPLKTRVFQCIFEWNIKVLTAAAEIFPLNSFFPPLCETQRLSSQIYSCLKSFFMSSLNWLMCEPTGYVNAKHKISTLSNSGIKMRIWGLWPWCQNSSVDFQPSPLQSNIFLISSWNCSVSTATSGRLCRCHQASASPLSARGHPRFPGTREHPKQGRAPRSPLTQLVWLWCDCSMASSVSGL